MQDKQPPPPHFPDPNADVVAVLEAALAERTEELAETHKEAKAWQAQLEAALRRIGALETRLQAISSLHQRIGAEPTSSNLGHG